MGIVWCVVWLAFGREGTLDETSVQRSSPQVPYAQLLLNPTILACWAAAFGANWALSLSLSWQGAYLIKGLGLAQSSIGLPAGLRPSDQPIICTMVDIGDARKDKIALRTSLKRA